MAASIAASAATVALLDGRNIVVGVFVNVVHCVNLFLVVHVMVQFRNVNPYVDAEIKKIIRKQVTGS
jgi:hypothetical protein